MPLIARRHIRKMRGGAQSHLIEAGDGNFYIVKFRNNPQHRRILVNELIAAEFLKFLQIASPPVALIDVTADFLRDNPEVSFTLGARTIPAEPGWHFGSRHPGHPERDAVYDFVPDTLLEQVTNGADFLGMLVFDKWMSNADGRQCVFFRARIRQVSAAGGERDTKGFVAWMIDHGYVFGGPEWQFQDSPVQGLYARPQVYQRVRSLADFSPWLEQVMYFPEHVVDRALKQVPPQWMNGEEAELESLLEKLLKRRKRIPELLEGVRAARSSPFPNWR